MVPLIMRNSHVYKFEALTEHLGLKVIVWGLPVVHRDVSCKRALISTGRCKIKSKQGAALDTFRAWNRAACSKQPNVLYASGSLHMHGAFASHFHLVRKPDRCSAKAGCPSNPSCMPDPAHVHMTGRRVFEHARACFELPAQHS